MNLKEKKYLLLDLDGVCYGKHNNYSLERVFGQVSKRMTQFIKDTLFKMYLEMKSQAMHVSENLLKLIAIL